MVRLSGYQPQYFPRLHYFARILDSDIFEFSDYVQFVKKMAYPLPDGTSRRGKSYQADTLIKTGHGQIFLTVPVGSGGLKPIHETQIAYQTPWAASHLKTVQIAYAKSRNFELLFPELEALLQRRYDNLADLTITTTLWGLWRIVAMEKPWQVTLGLEQLEEALPAAPFRLRRIVRLSQTPIPPSGPGRDATDWIIDICRQLDADEYYYGGTSAVAYMDFDRLKAAGIRLREQSWKCTAYTQMHAKLGFMPNLSIIDLLMNETPDTVRTIVHTV